MLEYEGQGDCCPLLSYRKIKLRKLRIAYFAFLSESSVRGSGGRAPCVSVRMGKGDGSMLPRNGSGVYLTKI